MNTIKIAADHLRRGGIIIFPTDTVFGIGCRISDRKAIQRLYEIKRRKKGTPTLILVNNRQEAEKYGIFNKKAKKLADIFWPGPLTLIIRAKNTLPELIKGPNNTIGIRQPKHSIVNQLISYVKEPILAPSANFAGQPTPTKLSEIDKRLLNLVDYLLESKCGGTKPSTIVEALGRTHRIIRTEAISKSNISKKLKGI